MAMRPGLAKGLAGVILPALVIAVGVLAWRMRSEHDGTLPESDMYVVPSAEGNGADQSRVPEDPSDDAGREVKAPGESQGATGAVGDVGGEVPGGLHGSEVGGVPEELASTDSTPAPWESVLGTDNLRFDGRLLTGSVELGEPIRAVMTIENCGHEPQEVDEVLFCGNSGAIALEVVFEGGYVCQRYRGSDSKDKPRKRVLARGEVGTIDLRVNDWVPMTMIGRYSVRVGIDPDWEYGDGHQTTWLGGTRQVVVTRPSDLQIAKMLEAVPGDAPWIEYNYQKMQMITDTGDERLRERFRELSLRIDADLKLGIDIPNGVAREIMFFEEKCSVWEHVRLARWSELRAYLEKPGDTYQRRRMQEIISRAYSARLSESGQSER